MKYLVLLLLSFNTSAEICRIDWVAPVERENDEVLPLNEIAFFTLFIDGVPRKDVNGNSQISNTATRQMWWGGTCPACESITMTTTDTNGRESGLSKVTCDYPNPPTVCR